MEAALRLIPSAGVASRFSPFVNTPAPLSSSHSERVTLPTTRAIPKIAAQINDFHHAPVNGRRALPSTAAGAARSVTSIARVGHSGAKSAPAADVAESAATAEAALRVVAVGSRAEYVRLMDEAARNGQLVVVEATKAALPNTATIYPKLLKLARSSPRALFLRVFADRSDGLREVAKSLGVAQIPAYAIFRDGKMVHVDAGMEVARLSLQMLYYSPSTTAGKAVLANGAVTGAIGAVDSGKKALGGGVLEMGSGEDVRALLRAHERDDALVVVMATLTFCGPCVRVHPTVVQLAQRMEGSAVFARVFGDANESTRALMRELNVVEAPTFLFYRRGELLGRYIGSGRGDLVGEVLKHQGVEV